MELAQFKKSLESATPPAKISQYLLSLWYEGKDNWDQAHRIAQDITTPDGSWLHAYLHRKEGDQFNASYWYARAGRNKPAIPLDEEWLDLVKHFIDKEDLS